MLQADRVEEAKRANPNRSIQDLAAMFKRRPNWVWELLRIGRLPDRIKDYVRGLGPYVNRSSVTSIDLLRISRLPAEAQLPGFDELMRKRNQPRSSKMLAQG